MNAPIGHAMRVVLHPAPHLESFRRWYAYSRARDMMFKTTDTTHAPWHLVPFR